MQDIFVWLQNNQYLAPWIEVGVALASFIIGVIIVSIFKAFYRISEMRLLKEGDAALFVGPVFWTPGKRYKVLAVHKYEKSDADVSGYKHISQNSRPDQWQKLIRIESLFLGCWHKIVPLNKGDILEVIISRDGRERYRTVAFNK